MPTEPPAPPSSGDQPTPAPTTAPAPRDRAEEHLNRGLRGVTTYGDIVAGEPDTAPTSPDDTPRNTKRKTRSMSVPRDIIERVKDSRINRTDLILLAADHYGDQIQHTPRYNTPGRDLFRVRLNDAEHSRLLRIADRRGWPLSPTVVVLLDLYLTEIETAQKKKSKRARAKA